MNSIKEKIAKLLALADSPNENEARAALLKARELMAEHKLRPEDCRKKSEVVRRELTGITCTKIKNGWAVDLSAIIAANYCCKAYRRHQTGDKKVEIGFVGLEDDIDICMKMFRYAFECASSECERIVKGWRGDGRYGRRMAESYGFGFCNGVRQAFKEQTAEKQEWGLVLVVPKAVTDSMQDMGKPSGYAVQKSGGLSRDYAARGYSDGVQWDPSSKLSGKVEAVR